MWSGSRQSGRAVSVCGPVRTERLPLTEISPVERPAAPSTLAKRLKRAVAVGPASSLADERKLLRLKQRIALGEATLDAFPTPRTPAPDVAATASNAVRTHVMSSVVVPLTLLYAHVGDGGCTAPPNGRQKDRPHPIAGSHAGPYQHRLVAISTVSTDSRTITVKRKATIRGRTGRCSRTFTGTTRDRRVRPRQH